MKRQTKQEAKIKAVCDIVKVISEGHTLETLQAKAKSICLFYFPKADEVFINELCSMAYFLQCGYCHLQNVDTCVKHYQGRGKKPISLDCRGKKKAGQPQSSEVFFVPQSKYESNQANEPISLSCFRQGRKGTKND